MRLANFVHRPDLRPQLLLHVSLVELSLSMFEQDGSVLKCNSDTPSESTAANADQKPIARRAGQKAQRVTISSTPSVAPTNVLAPFSMGPPVASTGASGTHASLARFGDKIESKSIDLTVRSATCVQD